KMAQVESDARDRTRECKAPEVAVELVRTPPTAALIGASEGADAVVVGARGHSMLSGVLLGSVSQHVARHAACPVVVTRQPYDPASTRVVVGVDGSGGSLRALEFGFEHADRTGASVTAIHAWRNLSRGGGAGMGYPLDSFTDEVQASERILAESVAGLAERYPDVPLAQEAIPVPPNRALADASQSAALLVVGSRGLGAFAGLMLGSISQSVLHHAQCPVAVVR
ncbi:MAG: universal stress protein, partial [Nocardioidaceae bacterium]